jgi:hypothetical protein
MKGNRFVAIAADRRDCRMNELWQPCTVSLMSPLLLLEN